MKPVEFEGCNAVLAKDQPQYQPLPVMMEDDAYGCVTSCWKLSWRERIKLLFTGKIWLSQYTFHTPLQPQLPSVDCPVVYNDTSKGYG